MDSGSIIVGGVLCALCLLPFLFLYLRNRKKNSRMHQGINALAKEHNCTITRHEKCGDFIIGIDYNKMHVFFFSYKDGKSDKQFVNLSGIQHCKSVHGTKPVTNEAGHMQITDSVELSFIPKLKGQTEVRFALFTGTETNALSGELQIAEGWSKMINSKIKTLQQV